MASVMFAVEVNACTFCVKSVAIGPSLVSAAALACSTNVVAASLAADFTASTACAGTAGAGVVAAGAVDAGGLAAGAEGVLPVSALGWLVSDLLQPQRSEARPAATRALKKMFFMRRHDIDRRRGGKCFTIAKTRAKFH